MLDRETPLPPDRQIEASRFLLLQAYDAIHTRPGGKYQPCALQQVRKGLIWSPAKRMAVAVEIFRKLTGDVTSSGEAIAASEFYLSECAGLEAWSPVCPP